MIKSIERENNMNTLDSIKNRKSTRAFTDQQISDEALDVILKAGYAAPVGMAKYDAIQISVVQNDDVHKKIASAVGNLTEKMMGKRIEMAFGFKTTIVISSEPSAAQGTDFINAGCIAQNMLLAAEDMGIASLIWQAGSGAIARNEELMKEIGIPEGYRPLVCASFGYAKNDEPAKIHTISTNFVK